MVRKKYVMVIDLHRCVGCAACDIACKSENNVPESFAWSNHMIETTGTFPQVRYRYVPTLCNHCDDAPCVTNCPTGAMYKSDEGLTLLNPDKCIGCRVCQLACPYGAIYFNKEEPHDRSREGDEPAIPGCTSSGREVVERSGVPIPHYNPASAEDFERVWSKGIVGKCTFCSHLLAKGESPACVQACPAGARIFGDLNDAKSPPRKALAKYTPRVLQPEKGTHPNVFYIRDY